MPRLIRMRCLHGLSSVLPRPSALSGVKGLLLRACLRAGSARSLLVLLLAIPPAALAQRGPEPAPELTLAEFLALLPAAAGEQRAEGVRRRAERTFMTLLAAQGGEAAARQSLDRLAGWTKAAESRLAAQSAPLLEVEMLRFAEGKAEALLERYEAERRRALAEANRLLGRNLNSPFLALTTEAKSAAASEGAGRPETGPRPGNTLAQLPEFAPRIERFEQELLPQAHDLLAKMYQNYLFGGVTLSALLWQEEQVRETERQYRLLLVEAERARRTAE